MRYETEHGIRWTRKPARLTPRSAPLPQAPAPRELTEVRETKTQEATP